MLGRRCNLQVIAVHFATVATDFGGEFWRRDSCRTHPQPLQNPRLGQKNCRTYVFRSWASPVLVMKNDGSSQFPTN